VKTPLELLKAWMATLIIPLRSPSELLSSSFPLVSRLQGSPRDQRFANSRRRIRASKDRKRQPSFSHWTGTRIGRSRSPADAAPTTRRRGHRLRPLFVAAAVSGRQEVQHLISLTLISRNLSRPSWSSLYQSWSCRKLRSAFTRNHGSYGTRASLFHSKSCLVRIW
jgi:hypothetical protein